MIKVNLLGTDRGEELNWQLPVSLYVGSLLLVFGIFFFLYSSTNKEIKNFAIEKESLEKELTTLRQKTKEVKDLESKRKELNSKLAVIAVLKKNKTGPVRVLDQINNSLPDRSWIESMEEKGGTLTISGFAIDPTTVSTFAKSLAQSLYIKNININEVNQTKYNGEEIQKFIVKAGVSYSQFLDEIRTQMLSENAVKKEQAPIKPKKPSAEE